MTSTGRSTSQVPSTSPSRPYDYTAGKVDWMAAGLPTVRADRSERRALELVDRHPATCAPDTPCMTSRTASP